ncbi:Tetraspanin-3 [Chionoecetes opilio]|uniref:Tetraspanin-3 n=1 Tax=Chionoecetes opilio TaxID=41210 RepID=A0A8J4XP32_CHIOP|nr:Tetraspanin-3 [Chionoecetes opilio]
MLSRGRGRLVALVTVTAARGSTRGGGRAGWQGVGHKPQEGVAGGAAAAVAGLLMGRHREYGALLGGGVFVLPLMVLFMGVGLLLLALLAWVGVLYTSACLLYTTVQYNSALPQYAGLLLVVTATEVVAVTLILVFKERTERAVQGAMTEVFRGYGDEDNLAVTFSLDRAQQKLQCCGVLSFIDWDNTTLEIENGDVPDGCCRTQEQGCGRGVLLRPELSATHAVYPRGCYTAVREQVQRGVPAVIAMTVIFILFQFVCVYYAVSAARKLKMMVAPAT